MRSAYHSLMKWNDRLREARDRAGKKNVEIAKHCKVSDATVNGWMGGGIKNIEAQNLLAVCRFLGVSPYSIVFGEDVAEGPVEVPADTSVNAAEALKLLALYARANATGRAAIMGAAIVAAASSPPRAN